MIEATVGGIALLLLIIALAFIARNQRFDPNNLDNYVSTDAAGCQINHRHLWEQIGAFPEVKGDSNEISFIGIYHCPVCVDDRQLPIPRVDTTERHQSVYES